MGNTTSLELEPLHRISGSAPVTLDDNELWNSLLALQLPSSSAEELAAASYSFCAEMVRNNPSSGNFQALVGRAIELLHLASKPKAKSDYVRQCCGCVFLLRLFLKHMIETLPAEELDGHLSVASEDGGGASSSSSLCGPLVEALLTVLVQCELNEETYWLHMECIVALLVGMSTQLYVDPTAYTPQPFLVAVLTSGGPGAELLVLKMLGHVICRPPPPSPPRGLLRTIGSYAGAVLLLPYYAARSAARNAAYLIFSSTAEPGAAPLALADRALHLLLLLTQHPPPALFGEQPYNPFLEALRTVGDDAGTTSSGRASGFSSGGGEGGEGDADGDPEDGRLRASRVPFRELHDALSAALPEQGTALLLYLLLHGNTDFLEYTLSRTDPETLLLPILKLLHESRTLPANQLYMVLIILLLVSQDHGFVSAAQTAMLPSVPWYTERMLGQTSVGSLLVIMLVRTVQSNLAKAEEHDAYVNTNCLAALANVAPALRKLHPTAARSLLSLVDVFCRKYQRHSKRASRSASVASTASADSGGEAGGLAEGSAAEGGCAEAEAVNLAADCLRIGLEVINLALTAGPSLNEHLVYALLERQTMFEPLRGHELFGDLLENIDLVLEFFGATLRAEPQSEQGQPAYTVSTVLGHIRDAGREWRGDKMRAFPDLKFTYEQEANPEEFFTPHLWNVVFESSHIGWSKEGALLLPDPAAEVAAASAYGADPSLPPLTEVDVVDESSCGPEIRSFASEPAR